MKRTTFLISLIFVFLAMGLQTIPAQVVFEHGSGVTSVMFSPDGTTVASGAVDGTVKLWNVETQTDVATFEGHAAAVASVAFSANGILLASGSYDGTVKLWNMNTHANIATLQGHGVLVTSVAFSPDGGTLASGAGDGMVKLWDVATHQNTATFGGYDAAILEEGGWITPVAFSPDGGTLAFGAMDSIELWDVAAEENIATFDESLEGVVSVSFSPDGKTLAFSSWDSSIQLWDVATGTNTATFPLPSQYFLPLPAFQFSPDGTQIAATLDENVALWDIETGTQINTLFGHTEAVRSVAFSSDGSLASGALDGTIRLWSPSSAAGPQESKPEGPLVASTAFPLTEANLYGNVVTLTLNGQRFVDEEWTIEYAISVSGIEGVAVSSSYFSVERISDTEVTVELEFDGTDFDTDATLAFTVEADAIVDSTGQGLTALIPVTAIQNSNATVSISPSPVVSADVGEQLTFSINIVDGENVAGYQATISYDPTALQPVDFTNGDYLPGDVFIVDPVVDYGIEETFFDEERWEGSVTVTLAANTLAGAANGNGTLATLTFKGADFKASTLALSQCYLVDTAGKLREAHVENAEITLPPEPAEKILGDINSDDVVNIQDLTIVGARLGQRGENSADLNGDHLVDIVDLVLVANAFGADAAAPSLNPQVLEQLTAADVKSWLTQASQLTRTDPVYLRGISVLEQLLMALTPKETALLANYPNPFNPETWIPYHLSKDADVTLHIYAVNGTLVRTLTLGHQAAGMYQTRSRAAYWDGRNEFGEKVASGLYFYTLTAGDFTATRKMLIRK